MAASITLFGNKINLTANWNGLVSTIKGWLGSKPNIPWENANDIAHKVADTYQTFYTETFNSSQIEELRKRLIDGFKIFDKNYPYLDSATHTRWSNDYWTQINNNTWALWMEPYWTIWYSVMFTLGTANGGDIEGRVSQTPEWINPIIQKYLDELGKTNKPPIPTATNEQNPSAVTITSQKIPTSPNSSNSQSSLASLSGNTLIVVLMIGALLFFLFQKRT